MGERLKMRKMHESGWSENKNKMKWKIKKEIEE